MILISVLTLLTAIFVATVSFFQWQTNHNKIVLDLFDRRFELWEQVTVVVSTCLVSRAVTDEMRSSYVKAMTRSRFLFGADVTAFLESRRKDLEVVVFEHDQHAIQPGQIPENMRLNTIQMASESFNRLSKFFEESEQIFGPYIRMNQKVRTFEWLTNTPKRLINNLISTD